MWYIFKISTSFETHDERIKNTVVNYLQGHAESFRNMFLLTFLKGF